LTAKYDTNITTIRNGHNKRLSLISEVISDDEDRPTSPTHSLIFCCHPLCMGIYL